MYSVQSILISESAKTFMLPEKIRCKITLAIYAHCNFSYANNTYWYWESMYTKIHYIIYEKNK